MRTELAVVKALIFDVFGTVVDWRSSIIAELDAFGRARGIAADWAGLADEWRAAYAPSMNRVRRGELPWTRLDDLHRQSLETLLGRFAVAGLSDADKDGLNRAWHRLAPWPDSVPGLTRMKQRYLLAPLSNGNVSLLANMAKRAGLPWDLVLSAELFRHYKPDPEVYDGACALLDLAPGEVMMVAAHNDDLRAARARGLKTAFVARPTEYGPRQSKDFRAEEAFEVVATDMVDLAAQLGL